MRDAEEKIIKNIETIRDHIKKLKKMIDDLQGCVDISLDLLQERGVEYRPWLDIEVFHLPRNAKVLIKDMDGKEVVATCECKNKSISIIYDSSTGFKYPMFWKLIN